MAFVPGVCPICGEEVMVSTDREQSFCGSCGGKFLTQAAIDFVEQDGLMAETESSNPSTAIVPASVPNAADAGLVIASGERDLALPSEPTSQASPKPKRKSKVPIIIGSIAGVLAIAAVVVFLVFFNPKDSAHFDAAQQAREAGDWASAKEHYEAISSNYYYHDWVEKWLIYVNDEMEKERVLREENPKDIALFKQAETAWSEGRLADAQTAYSSIQKTFYDYAVVEERLKLLSDNKALVDLTRKTWFTLTDHKNCAVVYTSKGCYSRGHFRASDIGWSGFRSGGTETGDNWDPNLSATVRVFLTTTGSSTIKVQFKWPAYTYKGSSPSSKIDDYYYTSESQTLTVSTSQFGSKATVSGVNNIPFEITVTDSYIDISVDYGFTGTNVSGHSRVCFYKNTY